MEFCQGHRQDFFLKKQAHEISLHFISGQSFSEQSALLQHVIPHQTVDFPCPTTALTTKEQRTVLLTTF
jgi:hypothetical protein